MKQVAILICAFAIILSCKSNTSQHYVEPETIEVPSDVDEIPVQTSVKFTGYDSMTIDIRDIKDSTTWIFVDGLDECFSSGADPYKLLIKSKYKIQSARLFINYLPTIWSDEKDNVLQYAQFPTLKCTGKKDVRMDSKQLILLNLKDLYELPENVKSYMSEISKEDLLMALETSSDDVEYANWKREKPIWKKYIRKYQPGKFIEEENTQFEVEPDAFVLQLTLKGRNGTRIVNLCDYVIIGN